MEKKALQRRDEGKECTMHAWARHGKEAEELRAGIEHLLVEHRYDEDHDDYRVGEAVNALCDELQELLDRVDARDSLAYRERVR